MTSASKPEAYNAKIKIVLSIKLIIWKVHDEFTIKTAINKINETFEN